MTQPGLFEQPLPPRPAVSPAATALRVEQARRGSSRAAVLARLKAGSATNVELNDICFRYGARIFELRRLGYRITRTPVSGGFCRYTLEPE